MAYSVSFCSCSINYDNLSYITSHLNSKKHIKIKNTYKKWNSERQQGIQTIIRAAESKKAVINEFLKAWVNANIPLEKVDKLRPFLTTYCREDGSAIPAADTLRRKYLPNIFEEHLQALNTEFKEKSVAIIIDETTDSRTYSVVNTLFSYRNSTKLVSVNYLQTINNTTIGQIVIQILAEWSISFSVPLLFLSDSAAYMKKCYRE
ncbi:2057_t:CDS:2 [Ambispora gerdemannii]|uniref:2057_t:CDS:1 n=1 Tax=Ambispora gerdemannii TaxID=144530 RepID=A0A9N9F6L0_9GLOM|nr:2057_t:CDS:2 [Ambispora gerdemannii]